MPETTEGEEEVSQSGRAEVLSTWRARLYEETLYIKKELPIKTRG